MPPWIKNTFFLLFAVNLICSAVMVYQGERMLGGIYLLSLVFLMLLYRAQLNRAVKANIIRMKQFGVTSFSFTTTFEEEAVRSQNHTTDAEISVKYSDIIRAVDTKKVMILFAGTGQFLMVFKNLLKAEEQTALKIFLSGKNIKV